MRDLHFNLFNAYRGATPSAEDSERQIEDNLTRALMITLDQLRTSPARIHLLRALGVDEETISDDYRCDLQVRELKTGYRTQKVRRLAVIHGGPRLAVMPSMKRAGSGRADAALVSTAYLLGIESKLGNTISEEQIERHRRTLELQSTEPIDVTWGEVARAARRAITEQGHDTVDAFTLSHFEEYLRMNGFGGFTDQHFGFFASSPDDRDDLTKDGIRRSLGTLIADLRASLDTTWEPTIGNIKKSDLNAWAALTPAAGRSLPHLSISVNASGLMIFANVENQVAHKRFLRGWKQDPLGLIKVLRALGGTPIKGSRDIPWALTVRRRVKIGEPKSYYDWRAVEMALPSLLGWPDDRAAWFVGEVTATPAGEAVPEIFIARTYHPAAVREPDFQSRLRHDADELRPFFAWLNTPIV